MTVKTAISLDDSLFEKVESMVRELKISRSRFFALAAQDYIKRLETQRMIAAINEAYEDFPDDEEQATLDTMWHLHRKQIRR